MFEDHLEHIYRNDFFLDLIYICLLFQIQVKTQCSFCSDSNWAGGKL